MSQLKVCWVVNEADGHKRDGAELFHKRLLTSLDSVHVVINATLHHMLLFTTPAPWFYCPDLQIKTHWPQKIQRKCLFISWLILLMSVSLHYVYSQAILWQAVEEKITCVLLVTKIVYCEVIQSALIQRFLHHTTDYCLFLYKLNGSL